MRSKVLLDHITDTVFIIADGRFVLRCPVFRTSRRKLFKKGGVKAIKLLTGDQIRITGYLLRYRVEQAKIALKNPENTISWVACCCGFYDASHFIRVFRQLTGMTPGEYRRSKTK